MTLSKRNTEESGSFSLPFDIVSMVSFICSAFYIFSYSILIKQESFTLQSFYQRIIGIAVLEGVDVVARTKLYIYTLVFTGILALILLVFLEKGLDKFLPCRMFKKERFFLGLLSLLGTANLLFGILTKNSVFLFNVFILLCLICCVITIIAFKIVILEKKSQNLFLFDDMPLITTIIILPITGVFAFLVIMGGPFAITLSIFVLYYGIFLILLYFLMEWCPKRFPQLLDGNIRGIAVNSVLPLYLHPVSIPLTIELQYWLSQWIFIDSRTLSLCILVFLLLISCILLKIQLKNKSSFFNPLSSIDNFSFPVLAATFALYANYMVNPTFGYVAYQRTMVFEGNLFEFGFTSTVLQQLFDFGKIPNIHLVAPHGLSDIYFAWLYSMLNGYQPIDCFLWNWMTPVLLAIVGYFLLKEFVEGHVAFLFTIFLPIFGLLSFNNFIFLIPAICFIRFWKDPHYKNYLILLLSFLICFVWRIESGIAAVLAFSLISFVVSINVLIKDPSSVWKKYSRYLWITIGFLGLCLFVYILLCLLNGISPASAFQSVVNLYNIQEIRGTFPGLYYTYDSRVALQYAILPLFGLGILIFFMWAAITRRDTITAQFILVTFITIGTLFLSQRGTQRHSLVEAFSWYYFPLVACLLPLLTYQAKKFKSLIILMLILGLGFLFIQYPLTTIHNDYSHNFFEFRSWTNHETRIEIQEKDIKPVAHLTEYLSQNLDRNETYYDMSNWIIPYTFLRKEFVPNSLFHMIQVGEYYQNETIRRLVQNSDRIPIVVTGGWQADGIPNELRTYRISEYVFTHYKPLGKIDNFEIWIRNDLNPDFYDSSDDGSYRIPFSDSNIPSHNMKHQEKDGMLMLHSGSDDPYLWNFLVIDSHSSESDSKYTGLRFVYTSDTAGPLQVFYSINNSQFSEMNSIMGSIKERNSYSDFYTIIPFNIRDITDIRIDPPNNCNLTLKDVYFIPQNSAFIRDEQIIRDYQLKKLPYIWGSFDTRKSILSQPVQFSLYNGEKTIAAGNPLMFVNIDPTIEKDSGNYLLLSLKSESNGIITLNYGNTTDSSIPATTSFFIIPSKEKQDYLLRISAQWNWYASPVTFIELNSSVPITLYECKILKGD